MKLQYAGLTYEFDEKLSTIRHYQLYPEMMTAVGTYYTTAPLRILVLGESHYLDQYEPANTAQDWYRRRDLGDPRSEKDITTRSIFSNAILGRARRKSKAIFVSLASALSACEIAPPEAASSLQAVAYMNFFQRPAECRGESIMVDPRDVDEAVRVLEAVTAALKPHLVVFATRLGWRHARSTDLMARFTASGVAMLNVPHPATSWWNRPSRPMRGMTGRQRFIEAVEAMRTL